MLKRYYWALIHRGDHLMLHRFRSAQERETWKHHRGNMGCHSPVTFIKGNHSEVRRVYRRLAAGEIIVFPCEIK